MWWWEGRAAADAAGGLQALLPGTYRQWLLDQGEIEEGVIRRETLRPGSVYTRSTLCGAGSWRAGWPGVGWLGGPAGQKDLWPLPSMLQCLRTILGFLEAMVWVSVLTRGFGGWRRSTG